MEDAIPLSGSGQTVARRRIPPDVALVIAMPVLVAVLAGRYEWNESIFAFTRSWESAQLDEWPIVVLVLALGLSWVSWRRSRLAVREMHAKVVAEKKLAAALAENQRLTLECLRIQESERKSLARELHDELAQYCNAIKLDAVSIIQAEKPPGGTMLDAAQRIVRAANHVHTAVNSIVCQLRPVGLDELGFVAAVESCVEQWRRSQPGTRFELMTSDTYDDLDEMTTLTLYRLIQEGLTNCARHACARSVEISVSRRPVAGGGTEWVQVNLRDDGRGAEASATNSGFGLRGMKERVSMLGGTFMIDSAPGKGFNIEAGVPAAGGG